MQKLLKQVEWHNIQILLLSGYVLIGHVVVQAGGSIVGSAFVPKTLHAVERTHGDPSLIGPSKYFNYGH